MSTNQTIIAELEADLRDLFVIHSRKHALLAIADANGDQEWIAWLEEEIEDILDEMDDVEYEILWYKGY